ncbi:MAG: hypothetical protein ACRD5B_02745, partial [Nitrososphaeraceae archaeon]
LCTTCDICSMLNRQNTTDLFIQETQYVKQVREWPQLAGDLAHFAQTLMSELILIISVQL